MRHKYLFLMILWIVVIFYLSSIPHIGFGFKGWREEFSRKCVHVMEFGILTFILWKAFGSFNNSLTKKTLLCAFLSILFAFSDELHQFFVVGRYGRISDALIDLIGAGAVLTWLFIKERNTSCRMNSQSSLSKV